MQKKRGFPGGIVAPARCYTRQGTGNYRDFWERGGLVLPGAFISARNLVNSNKKFC